MHRLFISFYIIFGVSLLLLSCATSQKTKEVVKLKRSVKFKETSASGVHVLPIIQPDDYVTSFVTASKKGQQKIESGSQWIQIKVDVRDESSREKLKSEIQQILNSYQELKSPNSAPAKKPLAIFQITQGQKDGLVEVYNLISFLETDPNDDQKEWAFAHIVELIKSHNLNFQNDNLSVDKAKSDFELLAKDAGNFDLKQATSFWSPRNDLENLNLYHGFSRPELLSPEECSYKTNKFDEDIEVTLYLTCKDGEYKLFFNKNVKVQVFNHRVFWALGLNVDTIDYKDTINVPYNRNLIKDINLKKVNRNHFINALNQLSIDPGHFYFHKSGYVNPFESIIAGALLNDGRIIGGAELGKFLLTPTTFKILNDSNQYEKVLNGEISDPLINDDNFNKDAEEQIKYLVLHDFAIKLFLSKKENEFVPKKSLVGPWSWFQLSHLARKDMNGYILLSKFLNIVNLPFHSNKLYLVKYKADAPAQLRHSIEMLSLGLGKLKNAQTKPQGPVPGDANLFEWEFTRSKSRPDQNFQSSLTGLSEFFRPFIDERHAKWMALKIAKIQPFQWKTALIAAGFSSSEVMIYLDKLVSRRDKMVKHFDLEVEAPLFRPKGIPKLYSYDPEKDPLIKIKVDDKFVSAPNRGHKIVKGKIKYEDL